MPILLRPMTLVLFFSLVACSGGGSNSRLDYKEAKSLSGLEVPPDLVAPENTGTTELVSLSGGGPGAVLPQVEGVRVVRDGAERWLVLDTPAATLWPRLRSFWTTLGLEVRLDKPELGIMETSWAENRADAPSGFITDWVRSVFKNAYSAGTRDKYRLRLERGTNGSSELFISHYGLKEVVQPNRDELDAGSIRWEVRPSDRELVNEVMNRMVLYLGGSEKVAAQAKEEQAVAERTRLEDDTLVISEGFARSWRRTGIALDRLGLVVEDRNRQQGLYYIGKIDLQAQEEKKGWLSSLFSSRDDDETQESEVQLLVKLVGGDSLTRLTVVNADGTPRRDELAQELLKRLQKEMK